MFERIIHKLGCDVKKPDFVTRLKLMLYASKLPGLP